MIECLTIANDHLFGDLRHRMYRFRHKIFIEREKYQVFSYAGMEFDEYDNPATTYFVYRNSAGDILGTIRVFPTILPYMIQQKWPEMLFEAAPRSASVWESSRIGVEAKGDLRRTIIAELILAQLEYGLARGIKTYIGVMPPKIWDSVFCRNGWPVRFLGPEIKLPEYPHKIIAAEMELSQSIERGIRKNTGIHHPVLTDRPVYS